MKAIPPLMGWCLCPDEQSDGCVNWSLQPCLLVLLMPMAWDSAITADCCHAARLPIAVSPACHNTKEKDTSQKSMDGGEGG